MQRAVFAFLSVHHHCPTLKFGCADDGERMFDDVENVSTAYINGCFLELVRTKLAGVGNGGTRTGVGFLDLSPKL